MLNERCDIIIVNWDLVNFLRPCIESIYNYTTYPFHIIVVDNGSTDPETLKYLDRLKIEKKDLTIIRNHKNEGFPRGANIGIRHSQAPYVCLLNNDTLVTPGWLEKLVSTLERHPKIAVAVANSGTFDSNSSWARGATLEENIIKYAQILDKTQTEELKETSLCSLFCSVFKRKLFSELGLLDEVYSPCNFEDYDFQMRLMKAGYISVLNTRVYVYHHVSKTVTRLTESERQWQRNKKIFYEKWGNEIDSLRILCPIWGAQFLHKNIENIYKILKRDNQILLVLSNLSDLKSILKEKKLFLHANLKVLKTPPWLFYFCCIVKILIKKKPFDLIYAPEEKVNTFFNKINIFLNKTIISTPENLLTLKKSSLGSNVL